jgi:nitroreductase
LKAIGPLAFLAGLWRILRGRPRIPQLQQANSLLQVILRRRSVRSFTADPVPDDVFSAILEAGRLAPSTVNLQTWTLAAFDRAAWQARFGQALPFGGQRAIIVLGDTHRVRPVLDAFPDCPLVEYTVAVMNASLTAMNMNLAAEALGVASVMLSETGQTGLLDAGHLRARLALPPGVIPLLTIVLGYPRGARPPMPPKLPLETIVITDGRYHEADPAILQTWLEGMQAGYKASHRRSSFTAQLRVYANKIEQAEADLRNMAGIAR